MNPAVKRYNWRIVYVMVLYMIFIALATYEIRNAHLTGWLAYLLAALPAIPAISVFVIAGIYLSEEKDEFLRDVFIQSMLWASGITLSFATFWGLLEIYTLFPHFDLFLLFPLYWGATGIASALIRLRYK
jgi:hypothetical protein